MTLLLTLLISAHATVVCKNGQVNLMAKSICVEAIEAHGKITRIAEGYGPVRFNQFTRFCAALSDGQFCECDYSFMGSPASGPSVKCARPDEWDGYASCVSRMRDECKR